MVRIVALAVSLAFIPGSTSAQSPTMFTVHHEVKFTPGTVLDHRQLRVVPLLQALVAEPFLIAREDLNDDGAREIIVMATTSASCGSGGCATIVAENRAGKISAILDQNLGSSLAVTNEKIGDYRALAAVGDKGTVLVGEKRGTPSFGKQMVYPMKVTQSPVAAARPAVPTPTAQAPGACGARKNCAEVGNFVAIVSDFRLSNSGGGRVITATVSFTNKTSRALVVGYVHDSGVVIDDQGNRYRVPDSRAVRGIGEIDGDTLDPKFSLAPGERSDARFEFVFRPGREILGTKYEIDLTFREINPVSGNQWQLGREHALNFTGFTDAGIAPTAPGLEPAAPALSTPPPAGPQSSPAADPCLGTTRCYNAGVFVANITQVTVTGGSNQPFVKLTMKITNVSNRPLTLAYRSRSGQLTDDAGNRYTNIGGKDEDAYISGIGLVTDNDADTGFVLAPGEARDASFDNWILSPPSLGTVYNYDLTLEEIEILPSKQVRSARTHVVGFHDFKAGASLNPAGSATDPCAGTPRCHSAGPFIANIAQVAVSGSASQPIVKVTLRIRNVSNRQLILAYRSRSGQLTDDAGNRYENVGSRREENYVNGIGIVTENSAQTGFVLAPGETRSASFDSSILRPQRLGSVYNFDLTLEELEVLPSTQVRSLHSYAVGFHDFKKTTGESVLDILKKGLLKKQP